MPKPKKQTRGGSKRGKVKTGRNNKKQRHTMTRLSVRKDQREQA